MHSFVLLAAFAIHLVKAASETREFPTRYDSVLVEGGLKAAVNVAFPERVTITAPSAALIAGILTEINGNILTIRAPSLTAEQIGQIQIVVNVESLTQQAPLVTITAASMSQVSVQQTHSLFGIRLNIRDSAKITAAVDAGLVNGTIDGSGIIVVSGTGGHVFPTIRGSGSFIAAGLVVGSATLNITGSGFLSLAAGRWIDGHIEGSAQVLYRFTPHVTATTHGFSSFVAI